MIKVSKNPRTARTLYHKKNTFGIQHDTENEQSRAESSDIVRAKTSQEKLWHETLPESSQWCRWGDARLQTAIYVHSHNWKCATANLLYKLQCKLVTMSTLACCKFPP